MSEAQLKAIVSKIEQIDAGVASNAQVHIDMMNKYNEMAGMFVKLMSKIDDDAKSQANAKYDKEDVEDDLVDNDEADGLSANDSLSSSVLINRRTKIDPVRPPPFSGEADGKNRYKMWKIFREQLNSYFDILVKNGTYLSDSTKASLLLQLLRSPAVDSAIAFKNRLTSKGGKFCFNELLDAMGNMYESTTILTNSYDDMFTLKQLDGQSVVVFYEEFTRLMNAAASEDDANFIHKNVASNCFINGLFESLQDKVNEKKIADNFLCSYKSNQADEAVLHCCQIALSAEQSFIKSGRAHLLKRRQPQQGQQQQNHQSKMPYRGNNTNYPTQNRPAPGQQHYTKPALGATRPTPSSTTTPPVVSRQTVPAERPYQPRHNITCFNCNASGHIARYCSKPPRVSFNMFSALGEETDNKDDEPSKK